MAHNRVRANKNTYDNRAKRGVETRKLPGATKQPLFKWGGGVRTNSAEARAYVAECRRREMAKLNRPALVSVRTDAQKLALAAARLAA